jgi:hypothetical protein
MSSLQHSLPRSAVFDLVSRARSALGMPPLKRLPRGIRETSRQCVLGRSLGVEILVDDRDGPYALVLQYRSACALSRAWCVGRPCASWNGWAVSLPAELTRFVQEFDACCYPELVSNSPPKKSATVSELRELRFDWVGEQQRVQNLIDRANELCDSARELCEKTTQLP